MKGVDSTGTRTAFRHNNISIKARKVSEQSLLAQERSQRDRQDSHLDGISGADPDDKRSLIVSG